MEGDSAILSFERNKRKIFTCIWYLKKQIGFYFVQEDAMAEFQKTWIEKFSEYYEDDKQYLNFMFIVMKNLFKVMKAKEVKWTRRHVSDVITTSEDYEEGCSISEVTEDVTTEKPLEKILFDEIKERIKIRLSPRAGLIFDLLLLNFNAKEIAIHAKCTAITVSNIKKREIWPIVKEVLNIPDEKYTKMCASTRLYLGRWVPEEIQSVDPQSESTQESVLESTITESPMLAGTENEKSESECVTSNTAAG